MKIIASCILALGALSQEASAFSSTKSAVRITQQQQRSLSKAPVLLNAASVDDSESDSVTTNSALDTIPADPSYDLLGIPARPGRPLKVAIAGGGVGGLTTAYYMLKKGFDVTVYEKTSEFARFGGPIQFASNALSVLKEMDDRLFDRIMDKFTFTGIRTCGIKDGLRSDGSFRMTNDSLDYLVNPDAPADWFVKFPLKECADLFGLPYTGVIDRPDLQEILLDECRQIKPDFIQNGNPVIGYENLGKGKGVSIQLNDGETAEADVLVGSDGIWSAIRNQMYNEGGIKSLSKNKKKRQGCDYSGYTVFAGETVLSTPDYYETGYKVYIGPQRYFVTSDVGDGRIQWYAFFSLPPGSKKAPSGWGGSAREDQADPEENLVEYVKSLHEGWSEEVMTVLDSTPPESVEQRDLYDKSPEFFRSWADGNVVLIGDAIHAMMPNLGQGGCQAIEDAYVLTENLANVKSTEKIENSLQDFYRKRILRVSAVQFLSRLASDLIVNAFDTPWSPHDDLGKSWKSYLTFFWKPILQYAIFPAQFAFLYSYYPSGRMDETAKKLSETWKAKHFESSEKAFKKAEEGFVRDTGPSFFQKAEAEEAKPEPVLSGLQKLFK